MVCRSVPPEAGWGFVTVIDTGLPWTSVTLPSSLTSVPALTFPTAPPPVL
jgi:hypothetical protein